MVMLSRSGSFTVDVGMDERMALQKATIDLPAELAEQRTELYDEMFDFAFDVLGVKVLELRVRAAQARPKQLPTHARRA